MSDLPPLPPGFVMQQGSDMPLPPPGFVVQGASSPLENKSYKGSILPFSIDAKGNKHLDFSAGITGMIGRAFTAPADAYSGRLQVMDNNGNVTPEAIERANEMAGFAMPLDQFGGAAVKPSLTWNAVRGKVDPVTPDMLEQAAGAGYDSLRNSDVRYAAGAMKDWAEGTLQNLRDFHPTEAPGTYGKVSQFQNPPAINPADPNSAVFVTPEDLIAFRRSLGKTAGNFNNPTDQAAAGVARGSLDQFMQNPPSGAVVSGDPSGVASTLADANANWAAAQRGRSLFGLADKAEGQAAVHNSGANYTNNLRQRLERLAQSDKQSAGFTDDEIDQIRNIARGGPVTNGLRTVGNLLGGGGGLGALAAGAVGEHATGSPLGFGIPIAGTLAKKLGDMLIERQLSGLTNETMMRSPLGQSMVGETPAATGVISGPQALAQALAASGYPQMAQNGADYLKKLGAMLMPEKSN